jgi:hypothetical protein
MAEDWRVKVELQDDEHGRVLSDTLEASQLERDVHGRLGDRIVISRDGGLLFLYADSEAAAREAERVVTAATDEHGWPAAISLTRWHPDAERWEPPDQPLPRTSEERVAEHEERIVEERRETAAEQYAQWEARVELPTLADARALSERLDAEGVPHVRRWRYVIVGAADEDAARAWVERLRDDAPAGSTIAVEGTFAAVERHNPFAVWSTLAGGP